MAEQSGSQRGGVRYENVDQAYLEQRKLRKSAGWFLLWGLGVGAVISGDFFGWNFGLTAGGFVGLAIATVLMATMYLCMVYSIAELSTALPHAGGFYISPAPGRDNTNSRSDLSIAQRTLRRPGL